MNTFKKFLFYSFISSVFLLACKNGNKIPDKILEIPVKVVVERFDQEFQNLDKAELEILKKDYSFLFPQQYKDTFWLKKSKDTLQLELVKEVAKTFPNVKDLEADLELFYKHLIYYYPSIKVPRVISLISEVDYKNRVVLTKELLLLSLDSFLGSTHYFYEDLQRYVSKDLIPEHILPAIGMEYIKKIVPRADARDFMGQLVLFGKRRYLLSKLLPKVPEYQIFEYTEQEYSWIVDREVNVWRYFIEKNMLYSTQKDLLPRFLYPAPFSKFYLSFDNESPDRVGQFIGYQIVLSFMENNNVSLQQLMEIDSKSIFNNSKYKPKK